MKQTADPFVSFVHMSSGCRSYSECMETHKAMLSLGFKKAGSGDLFVEPIYDQSYKLPTEACDQTGDCTSFTIHIELHGECALSVMPSCRQIFKDDKVPHIGTHIGFIVNKKWMHKLQTILPTTALEYKIKEEKQVNSTHFDEVDVLLPNGLALQFITLHLDAHERNNKHIFLIAVIIIIVFAGLVVGKKAE